MIVKSFVNRLLCVLTALDLHCYTRLVPKLTRLGSHHFLNRKTLIFVSELLL